MKTSREVQAVAKKGRPNPKKKQVRESARRAGQAKKEESLNYLREVLLERKEDPTKIHNLGTEDLRKNRTQFLQSGIVERGKTDRRKGEGRDEEKGQGVTRPSLLPNTCRLKGRRQKGHKGVMTWTSW